MKKKQQSRRKHVPERTCIACRARNSKRTLVRVVRLAGGAGVIVDETGKQKGRGAYLCRQRVCWDKALKHGSLNRALRISLTPEDIAALKAYAASLPEQCDVSPQGTGTHQDPTEEE